MANDVIQSKTILENVKAGAEDAGLILDDEDIEKASEGTAPLHIKFGQVS